MPELIRDDGVTLHYEIDGSGPPLMLIAGFMSDSASWAPLVPLLAPYFTLIRPDNRSTGRTRPWDAPASPALWADDACALLDHLGHPRAHVVGHSLGGNIAWVLAHRAPARVSTCHMLASAPVRLNRNTDLFRALIAIRRSDAPEETWLRALFPWLFAPGIYDQEGAVAAAVADTLAYPHAQSAAAMEHQLAALENADPAPFREIPDVPLRALLATGDLLIPLDIARAALPGIETDVIDAAGHSIHWDAPDAVAARIRAFAAAHPV